MNPVAIHQPSPEFVRAVQSAVTYAQQSTDEPIAFAAQIVPVYAQRTPDAVQAEAARAGGRMLLGLWVDQWPGLPPAPHGSIFLFEDGLRAMPGDLMHQTYSTLMHELDHALQRNHVLEAMHAHKAAAHAMHLAAQEYPQGMCCGH